MVIWIFGENYKSIQSLMSEYNNNYFWVFDPPKVPNIFDFLSETTLEVEDWFIFPE